MRRQKRKETSFEERVRNRLAGMRPRRNLAWLAGQLGICEETIRNWFRSPQKLKVYQRVALAQNLDISETELFQEVKEPAEVGHE